MLFKQFELQCITNIRALFDTNV